MDEAEKEIGGVVGAGVEAGEEVRSGSKSRVREEEASVVVFVSLKYWYIGKLNRMYQPPGPIGTGLQCLKRALNPK